MRMKLVRLVLPAIATIAGQSCSRDSSAPRVDTVAHGACAAQDASLTLPPGFCASILADGIGAARSPMNNFVDLLAHTRVSASTGSGQNELCRTTLWTQLKQQLCVSLDTMASPSSDFQGQSCNAFSVAWGFTGEPIYLDDAGRNYRPDPAEIDCGVIATPEQLCGAP